MNFKALTLGAVLGFVVAMVPSCGGTSTCDADTCNGCCDSAGKCVPLTSSNSNSQCGRGGVACVNCTSTSQTCNTTTFVCQSGTATGGGSGSTGGGAGATGGGTASTGGGTASTGGGTATGGGTGSTGGGSASTGGGSGSTGGGSGVACNPFTQDCTGPAGTACHLTSPTTSACFAGECDIVKQTCAAGSLCTYNLQADGGVGRVCVPESAASFTLAEGAACTQNQPYCGKGLLCVGGACRKTCYDDPDCSVGTACNALVQIQMTAERPTICTPVTTCNPLAPSCPSGEGCYPTGTQDICATAGTKAVNQTCNAVNDCVAGATCLSIGGAPVCKTICNLDGGAPGCGGGACGQLVQPDGGPASFGACQ